MNKKQEILAALEANKQQKADYAQRLREAYKETASQFLQKFSAEIEGRIDEMLEEIQSKRLTQARTIDNTCFLDEVRLDLKDIFQTAGARALEEESKRLDVKVYVWMDDDGGRINRGQTTYILRMAADPLLSGGALCPYDPKDPDGPLTGLGL